MAPVVARLENVSRLYGRFVALRRLTVSFSAGRCYLLLGENGAGKSTLLRILAGLLQPTSGNVLLNLTESSAPDRPRSSQTEERHRIGYMGHQSMLYDELSATENLRYFYSLYRGIERLEPEDALRMVGLDPNLRRPLAQYSQGMRQRAALARVLLPQPRLLLLDEPFSNVDTGTANRILRIIAAQRDAGRTVVLTTHQRSLAAPVANEILILEAGRLLSQEECTSNAGCEAPPARPQPEPIAL